MTTVTEHQQQPTDLATKDHQIDILYHQGKYAECETLLKDVLEERKTTLSQSDDNPDVLRTKNTLASVLKAQHRFAEAEHLLREIVDSDIRMLGPEDFDTLTSMCNLSEILLLQVKESKEAITLAQKCVVIGQRKDAGPDPRPDTATLMDNLANILARSQRLDEAEKMSREALSLRQNMLPKDDALIWTSLNNLAAILSRAGQLGEAEDLNRRALEVCRNEAARVTSISNLGGVLERQGRYEEAEGMFWEAVELAGEVLGRESEIMRLVKKDLAGVLKKQGKYSEAEGILGEH